MPLALVLLAVGALWIYMGINNVSFKGIMNDTLDPISSGSANVTTGAGTGTSIPNLAGAASTTRAKITAMQTMAKLLNGKPYVWGGGHSGWVIQAGYDCSGFVSAVLHAAGYLSSPQTTQTLPGQPGILSGPGQYVTIFDRTDGGSAGNDHVIIDIAGQWWESGGTANAGVHQISAPSASYLSQFNELLHPAGL